MASKKPNRVDVGVLNTIAAAAADITLASGVLSVTNLSTSVRLTDALVGGFTATAYAAGTLSVKNIDTTAITLAANTQYVLDLKVACPASPESDSRQYIVWSGAAAPTAASLRDDFIARINADAGRKVNAASGAGTSIDLTLISLDEGDFTLGAASHPDIALTTVTPYVEPAGTPAIVEAVAPGQSSPTATYTTYDISLRQYQRNAGVSGAWVSQEVMVTLYADAGATNYGAFNTELLAVAAGTHTPETDYLGI